jgi:hypothetical protein
MATCVRVLLSVVAYLAVATLPRIDPRALSIAAKTGEDLRYPTDVAGTAAQVPAQSNDVGSSPCGPPNYKCSYDGTDPKPLCSDCSFPPVPDMSARPNAVWYDKVLGIAGDGNQVVRCTYPETSKESHFDYGIGFGGSGDTSAMSKGGGSPFSYRLIISNSDGAAYPFTFTPDPVHPKCSPTYPIGVFRVSDGSFSWLKPHLYYAFGGYYFTVNSIDLDSIRLPERNPVVDFQQILPHDGPDWPGSKQTVTLGTIIKPLANNPNKYLYQATCAPRQPTCSPGTTGDLIPNFSQTVMTDTTDGAVVWRNIGIGFRGAATWYAVGGLSTGDDVFVKSFSDQGSQGEAGAIFVAAYKRSSNTYYLFNVGTGIISSLTCDGGSGFRCSDGSWTQTLAVSNLPDRIRIHNLKVSKNGEWVMLEQEACAFQTCSPVPGGGPGILVWELEAASPTVRKITVLPWGHWTTGFDLLVNQNGNRGENLTGRTFGSVNEPFLLNYYSFFLPGSVGMEAHPTWNFNDGSDTSPVCTATAGYDWPYTIPWENEVVCFGTNPNADCSSAGHGACRTTVKRFFRTYNPATCDLDNDFNGCMGIGALSPDGKYYAFTSNWGDTLGSTSRGGDGPGSCRGGFNFQQSHAYEVGDVFEPAHDLGDSHPNPNFNVFKVTVAGHSSSPPPGAWPNGWWPKQTAAAGFYANGDTILPRTFPDNPCNHSFRVIDGGKPSGPQRPVWKDVYGYKGSCNSVTTGSKVLDGGVKWTDIGEYVLGTMHLANLGRDDCRSDVFIGALN